jgi:hypothetical protein
VLHASSAWNYRQRDGNAGACLQSMATIPDNGRSFIEFSDIADLDTEFHQKVFLWLFLEDCFPELNDLSGESSFKS